LLTGLEMIKVLILPDGQMITTEVTKKQRKILDALNMCAEFRGAKGEPPRRKGGFSLFLWQLNRSDIDFCA
jgi:hypothetical protein